MVTQSTIIMDFAKALSLISLLIYYLVTGDTLTAFMLTLVLGGTTYLDED